eukprot:TRINITY_DN2491_c0_g1_i1.p2 TRINITY_DN2491_c0_g1~~TRINITY_DN2491_c0_g1_i1.p2  ORF type:complete len:133 (-),score=25.87 TRINITY_DN2491_c0_g1_i1:499-897(-)
MKLQWWSEVAPGELRFQCSFKRPSIEAVDEVVKRMSGDSLGLVDCGVCDILPEESLESTVHRLSIDMEAAGRQPSMEELAAGVAIVAANNSQGSPWCEEVQTLACHCELGAAVGDAGAERSRDSMGPIIQAA